MRWSALLAAAALSAAALAAVEPVFYADFENGYDGRSGAGVCTATVEGAPELADGQFGRALRSGPTTGYVYYPVAGHLQPVAGTVEMWVCLVDWVPSEDKFHVFFEAKNRGCLYLYKYFQQSNLLMLAAADTRGPYYSAVMPLQWQPGEWHHIAGTWSTDGVMVYVDGRPMRKLPVQAELPTDLGETFRIGDHPWQFERTTSSLIDEVRIYDRALSPDHIAAHFAGDYGFTKPLDAETVLLAREPLPTEGVLEVRVNLNGADVDDERVAVEMALVGTGQPLPAGTVATPVTGGQSTVRLPLPTLPGAYELVAGLLLDGNPIGEKRAEVIVPDTPWIGTSVGTEDVVLPPWTPMELDGSTVRCWGREHDFARGPLPSGINSAGEPLLSGPVSLSVTAGGEGVVWATTAPRASLSEARTRVEQTGRLTSDAIECRVSSWLEYDGVLWTEITAPRAAEVQRVSVEIPVAAAHAIYRHRYGAAWNTSEVTGNLPEGAGVVDKSPFIPFYWLGDNDRGLFWFAESDEMWPNRGAENAVEVERRDDTVILRLNVLAEGQTLPDGWKLAFGLQATPVKPIPKDWRRHRLSPGRQSTVSVIWPTPEADSLKYFGYPEATEPETFQARVDGLQGQGIRVVPYLCLTYVSEAAPEWTFFRYGWAMGPVDAGSGDVARYGAGFAQASPLGENYADFIIWKTREFIERYGIDGLYHDQTHPYTSARLEAGVGYERDAKRYPTFPLLAFRDLYRRMYAVIKSRPEETFTMAHMSGKVTIPILAYDDSYLDGEHFRGLIKDSYMDLFPLDTFRAEFMGRQWGIMPYFLPEFRPPYDTQVEPTRGLMGLLMVHDVNVWAIWCNADVVNEAFAALDEFGYVDADFIPYFDPKPPAATDLQDVYASAYKRADGAVLLIVANVGREDREGPFRIDCKGLGVGADTSLDWPSKETIALDDGSLTLTVPGLGYRMLLLEP
ncbi:MAG TPA: hypothetical protein DGT21_12155 [Armatimonadetes bacterium]|nr:hypothetical protein [Armatimonadota bacterium]